MHTKLLMILSAAFMALLGLAATFMPQELVVHFDSFPEGAVVLVVQVAGALYLGFAMLNWMARANLMGRIYSRPVAMGNFLHFMIVALALGRAMVAGQLPPVLGVGAGIYVIFAVWFGTVLFAQPRKP